MRKLRSLLFGISLGSLCGALLVTLFSPVTADEFRANWRAHLRRALKAGREASAKRRAELEAEYRVLRDE